MKKIAASATSDLATDNRVHKICETLKESGYEVILTGRRFRKSAPLAPRSYKTRRMRLLFSKGPFFYAEYNLRLFIRLILTKCDVILANDLDTLPASVATGMIRRIPVVYDSHEYFTEVPELQGRPAIRKIWEWIEKMTLPGVKAAFTVSPSIAAIYSEKYDMPFSVIRNIPLVAAGNCPTYRHPGNSERPFILYQGALNLGRGLEQAIRAMRMVPEADLVIAGSGDIGDRLQKLTSEISADNVFFTGRIPLEELPALTAQASLGISVEEDLGLNYRYALPNKLFDYIQAKIPVIVSNLPEMRSLVEKYNIGLVAGNHDPDYLATAFRKALFDYEMRENWRQGLEKASRELTWENEKRKLLEIFSGI